MLSPCSSVLPALPTLSGALFQLPLNYLFLEPRIPLCEALTILH